MHRTIDAHSSRLPQTPVDRLRSPMPLLRSDQPIAIPRKLVQKTIRNRVIGLPQVPYRSTTQREQHKEIQFNIPAGFIQVASATHLRLQYTAEFLARLLYDEVICNDPGGMQDPVELSILLLDCGHQLLELIFVADVYLPIAHSASLCRQSF